MQKLYMAISKSVQTMYLTQLQKVLYSVFFSKIVKERLEDVKKSLKIQNGQSKPVYRIITDNTMAKAELF